MPTLNPDREARSDIHCNSPEGRGTPDIVAVYLLPGRLRSRREYASALSSYLPMVVISELADAYQLALDEPGRIACHLQNPLSDWWCSRSCRA
jgi:hypothetical protein